jgi:general secretion pathway protein A
VRGELFPQPVLNKLHRLSSGIPRLINVLCDRALLGTYVQGKTGVDRKTLSKAAREVFGEEGTKSARALHKIKWLLGLLLLGAAGSAAYSYYSHEPHPAAKTILPPQPAAAFVPAPTTDLSWPARQPVEFSEVLAYQTIFRLWGAAWLPTNQESPCAQAEAQGLRCLTERGGLDTLRRLNRPAVLKLYDPKGSAYFAALTRLKGNSANLVLGTDARTVALEALALSWRGEFTLLWRLPPGYQGTIQPGSREPAVAWLDKLLAQHFQRAPHASSRAYDAPMVGEVKRFQLANGLQPDGVVGPATLIGLENVAASGIPLLREKP